MASAATMAPPHPGPGKKPPPPPPPPKKKASSQKKPPPPPPPPKAAPPKAKPPTNKRPAPSATSQSPAKRRRWASLSIQAPIVLRDVEVFESKGQVGEGTYGSVFVGRDKKTNEISALKRINTKAEVNGFPITALREVKILKALHHPNIVNLQEIVTSKDSGAIPKSVYMVFEYLEYDLTGILETPEIRFTLDHIKSWSHQLLAGTHYMHKNKVIHRDLKSSNLLINRRGELKIADWGLARTWSSDNKLLTPVVITLWYRPPEVLLGDRAYGPKIDMWSVGCIIAEMFRRSGFKGANEPTQLDLIFRTCGHPVQEEWPNIKRRCPKWREFEPKGDEPRFPNRLREALRSRLPNPKWMTDKAAEFIEKLLILNPDKRWSAEQALDADFFFENPIVKSADKLNMKFPIASAHEWECRKRIEEMQKAKAKQIQAQNGGRRT